MLNVRGGSAQKQPQVGQSIRECQVGHLRLMRNTFSKGENDCPPCINLYLQDLSIYFEEPCGAPK